MLMDCWGLVQTKEPTSVFTIFFLMEGHKSEGIYFNYMGLYENYSGGRLNPEFDFLKKYNI